MPEQKLCDLLDKILKKAETDKRRQRLQDNIRAKKEISRLINPEIKAIIDHLPKALIAKAELGEKEEKEIDYKILGDRRGYLDRLSSREEFNKLPPIIRLFKFCQRNGLKLKVDTSYYPYANCGAILRISW
ncbi:MAG: hypothetical protein WCT16_03255 [Candidatus Buchananbacteria bacterium]